MSKENLKKFFEEIEKDAALKNKFNAIMSQCAEETETLFSAKIVGFAQSAGFSCSGEDFKDAMAESGELSDEDMQKASGGYWKVYPPSWWYKEKYSKK